MKTYQIKQSAVLHFLTADNRSAWLWLVVRVYVGWVWLEAGWAKVTSTAWVGSSAGSSLQKFLDGALQKSTGAHPDVQMWYANFLQHAVMPHLTLWSNLVAYGELLVGIALILGVLTGLAALFGVFMNFNYLLAGTVSINPMLFILGVTLILSRRVAGYIGLDRYIRPKLNL